MGYFFTKVKEPFQFLCNKGKEGKIKKGLFFLYIFFLINKEVLISLGSKNLGTSGQEALSAFQ